MPGWTLVETHPTPGRIFQRPLDVIELWFFWNGLFDGAADGLQYCELRLLNGSREAHLFSDSNIVKAWLSTKRRYPLAGATVRGADRGPLRIMAATDSSTENVSGFASEPHFVVREDDLAVIHPREIIFGSVTCTEEAERRMTSILNGPRPLSEQLLTQLYVFRETNPERTDVLHLMILMAHCVTDRMAVNTFTRCLLDTLARGGGVEPAQIPLEERLAMTIPSTDLEPPHLRSLRPAIRRWRRLAGAVIFQLKMEKRQGGQTLPCRLTRSTPSVPARSGIGSTSLTHAQSAAVIANCRLYHVTFGNAFLALAQVALTRVLYRRYLRGEISEEEWEYRKRQPHIGGGPLSLRPFLDKAWFQNGGGGESMLSIGLFFYQLPFMTLGETAGRHGGILSDGAPPFSDLLTFDRFLHRAGLVQKQATAFFNHPLFLEIVRAATLAQIEHTRHGALQWMNRMTTAHDGHWHATHGHSEEVLAAADIPIIWAFGGSTAGSLNLMSPTEYPLPPTHPLSPYSSVSHPVKAGYVTTPSLLASETDMTPKIAVTNRIHIHARPAELYLTADSLDGQLNMQVLYDNNVFEEGVVREWLDEVKGALLWYLGQTHRSRRAQERLGGSDGQVGRGEGVQAKL